MTGVRTRPTAPVQDPARRAAIDTVLAVDTDGAFANLLLPRLLRERSLSPLDASFATELSYGTLRRQGVLDLVVERAGGRAVATLDPPVRASLRLGAYQLLHTRVPPHAAVSATVELSRQVAGPKPAGLVNAVLRRVAERDWPAWLDLLAPAGDPLGTLALRHGYPRWVAAAVLDALGGAEGDLGELAAALVDERPVTHLVARPGRISRSDLLAQAGEAAAPGPWSPYSVVMAGGDPARIAAVRDRRAGVQDEGSQLVALALAAAPLDGPDHSWLDLCAGPGGKAALLPPDGRLVANDLAPHRARLVAQSLRGSAGAAVVVADGRTPPWPEGGFDRVLVDVPCSGLGALRRRPEVRWRRSPADVAALRPLQEALLDQAVTSTRPGGVVAYATCSPHPDETRGVVAAVTARRADVVALDTGATLPPRLAAGTTAVQLWPHRHGTDAMFVALLRRTDGPHGSG